MNILAVESSCDDISWALVKDAREILSMGIVSQVDIHTKTGGVVPEVAAREHAVTIIPTLMQVMEGRDWKDVDAIAVTAGPGLLGSLLVGMTGAQTLAILREKPLIPVHHIEGHVYANWLDRSPEEIVFPAVVLTVSGGHNDLYFMEGPGQFTALGQTQDDAAGEAFDKVARLCGLGYPGGPAIERHLTEHPLPRDVENPLRFPRAKTAGQYDWSFSGLKSDVRRTVEQLAHAGTWNEEHRTFVLDAFEEAVVDALVTKTTEAFKKMGAKTLLVTGGVSANSRLRDRFNAFAHATGSRVLVPVKKLYCTDNAAMIGAAAYMVATYQPEKVLHTTEEKLRLSPALRYSLV